MAQGGRRHSATESSQLGVSYAEEVAKTFAHSRGQQQLPGGPSLRGTLQRHDTPVGPLLRDSTPPGSRSSSLGRAEILDRRHRSLSEQMG